MTCNQEARDLATACVASVLHAAHPELGNEIVHYIAAVYVEQSDVDPEACWDALTTFLDQGVLQALHQEMLSASKMPALESEIGAHDATIPHMVFIQGQEEDQEELSAAGRPSWMDKKLRAKILQRFDMQKVPQAPLKHVDVTFIDYLAPHGSKKGQGSKRKKKTT